MNFFQFLSFSINNNARITKRKEIKRKMLRKTQANAFWEEKKFEMESFWIKCMAFGCKPKGNERKIISRVISHLRDFQLITIKWDEAFRCEMRTVGRSVVWTRPSHLWRRDHTNCNNYSCSQLFKVTYFNHQLNMHIWFLQLVFHSTIF